MRNENFTLTIALYAVKKCTANVFIMRPERSTALTGNNHQMRAKCIQNQRPSVITYKNEQKWIREGIDINEHCVNLKTGIKLHS